MGWRPVGVGGSCFIQECLVGPVWAGETGAQWRLPEPLQGPSSLLLLLLLLLVRTPALLCSHPDTSGKYLLQQPLRCHDTSTSIETRHNTVIPSDKLQSEMFTAEDFHFLLNLLFFLWYPSLVIHYTSPGGLGGADAAEAGGTLLQQPWRPRGISL